MARGRDATDVAIVTSFGQCALHSFKVITEEITSIAPATAKEEPEIMRLKK
jgi:hypothetical protein